MRTCTSTVLVSAGWEERTGKDGRRYFRRAHEGGRDRRFLCRQDVPRTQIHPGHLQGELSQHDRCVALRE